MRAAETPLKGRIASIGSWALGLAIVAVVGSASSLAPQSTVLAPGSIVSYSEDRLGRPWTIVRRIGYQSFEIRNGRVLVIADAGDMSGYQGYSSDVSVQLAGVASRDKIIEIQRSNRSPQAATELASRVH
jgi:hypothetical protein